MGKWKEILKEKRKNPHFLSCHSFAQCFVRGGDFKFLNLLMWKNIFKQIRLIYPRVKNRLVMKKRKENFTIHGQELNQPHVKELDMVRLSIK